MTIKMLVEERPGKVLRVYPHGTRMIWSNEDARSYPYYGDVKLEVGDEVSFVTDGTDTFVVSVLTTT